MSWKYGAPKVGIMMAAAAGVTVCEKFRVGANSNARACAAARPPHLYVRDPAAGRPSGTINAFYGLASGTRLGSSMVGSHTAPGAASLLNKLSNYIYKQTGASIASSTDTVTFCLQP